MVRGLGKHQAIFEPSRSRRRCRRSPRRPDGRLTLGTVAYNMKLSEARGRTVRDWLGANGAIPASTPIKAYGKRVPIAPNTTPDGRDGRCLHPTGSGPGGSASALSLAEGSGAAFGPLLATATKAGRSM